MVQDLMTIVHAFSSRLDGLQLQKEAQRGYRAGHQGRQAVILAHKIALDPTVEQASHLARVAGTARFAYNWALAEWKRQYEAGEKPSAAKLKAQWNGIRRIEFPWSLEVTKCASGQAIMNLGVAYGNYFRDLKKPKDARKARKPKFKKKGQHDSFALWNDQFEVRAVFERFGKDRGEIRVPNLGWVRMREPLRIDGRILGAVVSRTAADGRCPSNAKGRMPNRHTRNPAPWSGSISVHRA
jgi:putative transposase